MFQIRLFLFSLLLILGCTTIVNVSDQCSQCSSLKSQIDCLQNNCVWKLGVNDTQAVCDNKPQAKPYCHGMQDKNCASTYGCAYLDGKCTTFAGCSAYVKTTTFDCQNISIRCISDGQTCIEVQECKTYDKSVCETTPNLFQRKCKWDNDGQICRDYQCFEADQTYTTDDQCKTFAVDCITTGAGCTSYPLSNCALLPGTEYTCPMMTGADGKCKYGNDSVCALKLCSDYPNQSPTDEDCQQFQSFCLKSTGKGCVTSLQQCSSYNECFGYIGSDGPCEGDYKECRTRICDNGIGITDDQCNQYKEGCVTNGIKCVTKRMLCSQYKGTKLSCYQYIGLDGRCKGKNDKYSTCMLRDCEEDSQITYTTDKLCQDNIQINCLSTGQGCVKVLQSCTSYTSNEGECNNRFGSDGRCKAGEDGKCMARQCSDAPTSLTTNAECWSFRKGCVTNEAGCIDSTTCDQTIKQSSCLGTFDQFGQCNWNGICVNQTSCSDFQTKSICLQSSSCFWDGSCRLAICTDFQGTAYQNDYACQTALSGCAYNGIQCVSSSTCNNFKGTKEICLGFNVFCTNFESAAMSDTCIPRECSDNVSYSDDIDCWNYYPGCITNGNGCISNTASCSSYTGTQQECDKFYGYQGFIFQRSQCWNTSIMSGACIVKLCEHANQMTSDSECNTFLNGCIYNGNNGCIPESSDCSQFTGSNIDVCQVFKGNFGNSLCWWVSGDNCITKMCSQDTISTKDEDCNKFLPGCVTKGIGCIDSTAPCTDYEGTDELCNSFTQTFVSGLQVKCTKIESCTKKECSNKIDAISNADCLNYHQNCRLGFQTQYCINEQASCSQYILTGINDQGKQLYCNEVTLNDKKTKCAYNPSVPGTCSDRQCSLWVNQLPYTCVDYLGLNSCKFSYSPYCYSAGYCQSYIIPSQVNDKQMWCFSMYDNSLSPQRCAYNQSISQTNCSAMKKCEDLLWSNSAADCNSQLNSTNCQQSRNKCYTTQKICSDYPAPLDNAYFVCSQLKASNDGIVTSCQYDVSKSIQNCSAYACADIKNPQGQKSCDQAVRGCKYFENACYTTFNQCSQYIIPSYIYYNQQKRYFCQHMQNIDSKEYCSYTDNESTCNDPISCADYNGENKQQCNEFRDKTGVICTWSSGTQCEVATDQAVCQNGYTYYPCEFNTNVPTCFRKQYQCVLKESDCTFYDYGSAINVEDRVAACQMNIDTNGNYCSWFTESNSTCEISKATCADWSSLSISDDNTYFCKARIDKTGQQCSYHMGSTTCRTYYQCESAFNPQSQVDCDYISSGCLYYNKYCYSIPVNCNSYRIDFWDDVHNLSYCNGLYAQSGEKQQCTFLKGMKTCITRQSCNNYSLNNLTDIESIIQACNKVLSTDLSGCTYWNGTFCIKKQPCSNYTSGYQAICHLQKNDSDKWCIASDSDPLSCISPINCEAITNAQSQLDCDKYLSGCIYKLSQCFTLGACTIYITNGGGAIDFCNQMQDPYGNKCRAYGDEDLACAPRYCSDVSYSTHEQCQAYLQDCKSDGEKCVDVSKSCANQQGNPIFCQWAKDTDGKSSCTHTSPSTTSAQCVNRKCSQNIISTTDADCQTYLINCLTNGNGCISNDEPCNKYYGNIQICQQFTGNFIKCWGKSDTIRDTCRDRLCTDNTSATNDPDCEQFLSGCVTTGQGCISMSEPCSAYKGTQSICQNFRGLYQTILCYNSSSAVNTTNCRDRQCSDLYGISDLECATFNPFCVTNGTKCVSYPITCSEFTGTEKTCPQFTAIDGPCKTTTYATTPKSCTPRVCNEAPNTLKTDFDCQAYHPTCMTNGRGCVKQGIQCKEAQTQTVCNANIQCQWIEQCSSKPNSCSELTKYGPSICVNTLLADKLTYCIWSNNKCHNYTCDDYDSSYNTHQQCQSKDLNCTTNGSGCIVMGLCSSYKTPSICNAAQTTETSKRCTWEANESISECRRRKCTDFQGTTNEQCNEFLNGCKTSGTGCIGPGYECSVFTGNEQYCQIDSFGNPCLYINGVCYKYTQCSDAIGTTLEECQQFNNLCVPDGSGACIAQTKCEKYTTQQSCRNGSNNTICGWLGNQCQIFGNCFDLTATSYEECNNYGLKCITDGTKCINMASCSSYLTQISCTQPGSDGDCIWDAVTNQCRLRQCSDYTAFSDIDCSKFQVSQNQCTSDGKTCVARATCTDYTNEAGCTIGVDGIPCIFAFPIGQTTGTKSCRVKECSDIKGTTNDQCIGVIGKKCVSNGTLCVKQEICANYTNKISCNGGGSDGACAFKPTSQYIGTCQKFSACEIADNDQAACIQKSSACQWTSKTEGFATITSCRARTCSQISPCQPIPSFDHNTYTICDLVNGVCSPSDPSSFKSATCYMYSVYSYTWNELSQKCQSCKVTNETNNSNNNSTNGQNQSQSTNETILNEEILGMKLILVMIGFLA